MDKYEIQNLKDSVPIETFLHDYLGEPNPAGFYHCPEHDERTPSMRRIPNTQLCHCFGCGKTWDVIGLAKVVFRTDFRGAVDRLSQNRQKRPYSASEYVQRENTRLENERRREQIRAFYDHALTEWTNLDKNLRLYAPRPGDDELDPRYVDALARIDTAAATLDSAAAQLREAGG